MKLALDRSMKQLVGALALVLMFSSAGWARRGGNKKPKPAPAPAAATQTSAPAPAVADAKQPKVKVYSFTGLDVEGKLKTPQLLYFLNRIKAEFDTSTLDKRSFMKELESSADDKAL